MGGSDGSNPFDPTNSSNSTNDTNTTDGADITGQSVDSFKDVSSQWEVSYGKLTTTTQDVFQGDQSIVLQPKKNGKQTIAKVSRTFYPEALDLSGHDLSLAAKVNKPDTVKIRAEIIAPAQSSMLTATRHIPKELDEWVRFDIGYTDKQGNPVMDNVAKINLQIGPMKKPFEVLIDDLRKVPKANTGKVMFQFDDGHVSAYETVYPLFKEKDWTGSVAVIPNAVGGDDRISEANMREMGKNGWDMVGHASELLPKYSSEKQRQILQETKRYLDVKGFKRGSEHFIVPYHRVNGTSLKHISELFKTAYLQGGGPNNARRPSNPAFISRVNGESIRGTRRIVNMAAEFNQLAVIYYHEIGGEGVPVNALKKIIDHVDNADVDVITPSQLVDSSNW
ncbi:polysaccharide deacetylase family protein [Halocatena salina]|uniref:Polysaccharide deacetylase family protein n=1 Tax=Halocatena salina TaxID=2934340 RepID=A0A8T9ZYK9_9EURY|nr:polysaccharide deacetylase family protein [Halocatena salina]UPM41762.1 polysaccharide deacetylase family protein [Halocatena salina]